MTETGDGPENQLSKNPGLTAFTVLGVIADLAAVAALARNVGSEWPAVVGVAALTIGTASLLLAWSRRKPAVATVAVIGLALGTGVVGYVIADHRDGGKSSPDAAGGQNTHSVAATGMPGNPEPTSFGSGQPQPKPSDSAKQHQIAFPPKTFTIRDEDCRAALGIDFDQARIPPEGDSGSGADMTYTSCAKEGGAEIFLASGAESMAFVEDSTPTYEQCEDALATDSVSSFRPHPGDTICIRTSSEPSDGNEKGQIIGYATIEKVVEGNPDSIVVKASGWLVD